MSSLRVNNTAAAESAHKEAMQYIQEKYGSDLVTQKELNKAVKEVEVAFLPWWYARLELKDLGIQRDPEINRTRTNNAAKAAIAEFDRADSIYQPLLAKRTAIYEKLIAQRKDYDEKVNTLLPNVSNYYNAFKALGNGKKALPLLKRRSGGPNIPFDRNSAPPSLVATGGRRRGRKTSKRSTKRRRNARRSNSRR
jgi:hypothetical protein